MIRANSKWLAAVLLASTAGTMANANLGGASRAISGEGGDMPETAGTAEPEREKNWAADEEREQEADERRRELDSLADQTLERLTEEHPGSADLLEEAYGYAVFGGVKAGALITGSGGSGVAVEKQSGDRTYMRMAAAGIGVLGGAQEFNLVVLFRTRELFERFVSGTWDAGLTAQAAALESGANAAEAYREGVAVYQFTEAGLIAQAEISGARFWADDDLNDGR